MVKVYSKNNCPQCRMVKNLLEKQGVEFKEINIDSQPDALEYVKSLGFRSVPLVEKEGQDIIQGFDIVKLRKL